MKTKVGSYRSVAMSNLEYGDEDEPPPLEDLSEEIAAALNLKTSLTSVTQSKSTDKSADISALSSDAKLAVETATVLSTSTPEQSVDIKSSAKSAASKQSMSSVSEFGGMNKGFLFGGGKNKSQNSKPKRQEELTVIKSRPENSSLKFDDVQKTQTETPAWITDSLLGEFCDFLRKCFFKQLRINDKSMLNSQA